MEIEHFHRDLFHISKEFLNEQITIDGGLFGSVGNPKFSDMMHLFIIDCWNSLDQIEMYNFPNRQNISTIHRVEHLGSARNPQFSEMTKKYSILLSY